MGKNSVVLEKKMAVSEVVSFLESVIASLKEGKIVLQQGTQLVVLTPNEFIDLEVEASQKKDKGKLSIDLKWLQQTESIPEADILVSSKEPEPELNPEPKKKIEVKVKKTEKKKDIDSKKKTMARSKK